MHSHRSLLLLAVLAASAQAAPSNPPQCWNSAASIPLTDKGCDPLTAPQVSCYVPGDVEGQLQQANMNTRQRATDLYAWQQFIALNWPADAYPGRPDPRKKLDAPGARVWETWRSTDEVFLPSGADPGPWEKVPKLPEACAGTTRVLTRTMKVDDLLDAVVQPTGASATLPPILNDQKGHAVRYEIRMNEVLYNAIRKAGLYNGSVQAQTSSIQFPPQSALLKAAWREVNADEGRRFLTTQACLCDTGEDGRPRNCSAHTMGLVGFHLMVKAPSAPQWVWATFEQEDNVTSTHGVPASFNNPSCASETCPPNHVTPVGTPTQVTRVIPIPDRKPVCANTQQSVDDIRALDADVARALRANNSVLGTYQLIDAQWPVLPKQPATGPTTVFDVRPALLGNTTMETFIQDASSCMGCHAMAGTNRPDKFVSSDFSFTLNDAHPRVGRPAGPPTPPVFHPGSDEDAARQALIQRGFMLATNTYELRPDVSGAKLHCSSCHLDAGRNPQASWWVDMARYYPTHEPSSGSAPSPAPQSLQVRINHCFANSLNGKNLCVPGTGPGTCSEDPDMKALVAYMGWVTRQYVAFQRPARGFPALPTLTGDAHRGHAVFTQKCAFCHGADGQGRYQDGVYYRPALWGPRSFNASAGMGTTSVLAAFIQANMPFGSGGELTAQEAWDLATFIEGQCRPGKTEDANHKPCNSSQKKEAPPAVAAPAQP